MRFVGILFVIYFTLITANCAPQEVLSTVGEAFLNISTGIVDIANNAKTQLSDMVKSNGSDLKPESSQPNVSITQNEFSKFLVDIFTGVQAIIIGTVHSLGLFAETHNNATH